MRPLAVVLVGVVAAGVLASLAIASAAGTGVTGGIERVVRTALRQPDQEKPSPASPKRPADRLGRESTPALTTDGPPSVRETLEVRRREADGIAARRETELGGSDVTTSASTQDAIRARRAQEARGSTEAAPRAQGDRLRGKRRSAKRPRAVDDRLRDRENAKPKVAPSVSNPRDRLRGRDG